jgi:hypothetical protein
VKEGVEGGVEGGVQGGVECGVENEEAVDTFSDRRSKEMARLMRLILARIHTLSTDMQLADFSERVSSACVMNSCPELYVKVLAASEFVDPIVREITYGWEVARCASHLFDRRAMHVLSNTDKDKDGKSVVVNLLVWALDVRAVPARQRWSYALEEMDKLHPLAEAVQLVFVLQNADDFVPMPTHVYPYGKRNIECRALAAPDGKNGSRFDMEVYGSGHFACMAADAIRNVWEGAWLTKPGYDASRCNRALTRHLFTAAAATADASPSLSEKESW